MIFFVVVKNIALSLLFLFSSCSLYRGTARDWHGELDLQEEMRPREIDYVDHLKSLATSYISSQKKTRIMLSKRGHRYLKNIYRRIAESNKKVLGKPLDPTFIVLNNKMPFIFSLPGAYIFLSSGLVANYLGHEEMLVAAIAHEVVRSQLNVYQKKRIVPIGYVETERVISLTRINLSLKMKANKWTYYSMTRAGFDGYAYLLWVQIQNKNALDFLLQLGDLQSISKEEYLFKSFIAEEVKKKDDLTEDEMHSSKGFYRLRKYIQARVI